jgi:hypothetical protein
MFVMRKSFVSAESVQPSTNSITAILAADTAQSLSQAGSSCRRLSRWWRWSQTKHALSAKRIERNARVVVEERRGWTS